MNHASNYTAIRLAAIALGVALFASCGGSDGTTADEVTTTDAAATTVVGGAVTTAESASTTVAAPVATPEPTETTTAATESAPTAAPAGYELSAPPTFDSLLENQKSDPISDPLPDGQYWSWDYTSDGEDVSFTLVQYFVGDACREQFGDGDEACASDNDTLYSPSASVTLADAAATSVVACCDEGSFVSYRVSTGEFTRLVAGIAPAPDAPAGFTFAPFGVVVTVQNGEAIAADQIFTS